jgi:circadian clock protein KaiC
MLGGKGYFRGSTILVSGTAGTGKTSVAAHFAHAACARGERCLIMAFEESPSQYLRNMASIGIDLKPFMDRGLLRFHATRSTSFGLEVHLATAHRMAEEFHPRVVVIDPINSMGDAGTQHDAGQMLTRMLDYLKGRGVTTILASLSPAESCAIDRSGSAVSSLVDAWVMLTAEERDGRRQRGVTVLKARGMAHADARHDFAFTRQGLRISEPVRPAKAAA